jgi:hypothetical protein
MKSKAAKRLGEVCTDCKLTVFGLSAKRRTELVGTVGDSIIYQCPECKSISISNLSKQSK